jgi:hypothetical protein
VPVATARWWWLGVHGGAGVTVLDALVPGGADAHRRWQSPRLHPGPEAVVLVCRTHLSGLVAAQDAVQQWRGGSAPDGVRVVGVVAVADAPGRLARAQTSELARLTASAPALWRIPWFERLRAVDDVGRLPRPEAVVRLAHDLTVVGRSPRPPAVSPAPRGDDER